MKKNRNICCVFNFPSHYNYAIYQAMGEELGCEFYFFDSIFQDIKPFETSKLKGFQKNIHSVRLGKKGLMMHTGIGKIFQGKYTHYIISGSSTYLINWLILLYCKLFGKKVFIWCHGLHAPLVRKRSRFVAKTFFAHADGLLMYNNYYMKNMMDIGCKPERLFCIHNSLDTNRQTEIYNSLQPSSIYFDHFGNNDPVALYIGRVQKRKKIDKLIKAVKILNDEGKRINLSIVGGISDDTTLANLTSELKLQDRVWFYGASYDEANNAQLIYNAAVCVCPERVGLTSIHSLTYGTPLVSNNNFENQEPEFEAINDGVTGSFYQENDVEDLAMHIWRWANVTSEERDVIRKAARKNIENEWSVDYQIDLLRKVIV